MYKQPAVHYSVVWLYQQAAAENCGLLSYYAAASSGNFLPSFRGTYRSPLQGWSWDREVAPKRRQGITTTRWVITQKNAVPIHFAAEA